MSDPFRDDHDAAVARAESLQDEVDRLEREKTELAAKLVAAEAKSEKYDVQQQRAVATEARARAKAAKDAEMRSSSQAESAKSARIGWIAMGAFTLLVLGAVIVPSCKHKREHERWVVATEVRKTQLGRWHGYLHTGECVRQTESTLAGIAALGAEPGDPRTHAQIGIRDNLIVDCVGLSDLIADDTLAPAARASFTAWARDLARFQSAVKPLDVYLAKADWKDDDYASGPAKWAPVVAARDQLIVDLRDARAVGIPAVDRAIAAIAKAQAPGSDASFRIAIGAEIEALDDVLLTTPDRDRARSLAAKILEDAKVAPIEVRREVRAIAGLEAISHVDPDGRSQAPSNPLWSSLRDDRAPFYDPGSEPADGCNDGD